MGLLCCTSLDKEGVDDSPDSENKIIHFLSHSQAYPRRRLYKIKMPQIGKPGTRSQMSWRTAISDKDFANETDYEKARASLQAAERERAFGSEIIATSSSIEKEAVEIVRKIRLFDWENTYGQPCDTNKLTGKKAASQHFLGNVDLINKTRLMQIAKRMPKGAHLHIHFNSCLPAKFLIRQARDIDAMYIRSNLPLTTKENRAASRISFMVLTRYEATHVNEHNVEKHVPLGNLWEADYVPNSWMSYKEFQRKFEIKDDDGVILKKTLGAESWLERKMQITEEEAHGTHQTGRGYVMSVTGVKLLLMMRTVYGKGLITSRK